MNEFLLKPKDDQQAEEQRFVAKPQNHKKAKTVLSFKPDDKQRSSL